MRFCLISPSMPTWSELSFFLSCLVSSRRLIVYYGVQLFPVNQNAPLRARLACQVVARNSIVFARAGRRATDRFQGRMTFEPFLSQTQSFVFYTVDSNWKECVCLV
jgi:hypothetical protein